MFDYELLENQLNEEIKKILLLIKQDYYVFFSDQKKSLLDSLIECDKVIIVNQGTSHFNDNTLAHGGRTLGDGKIHFYPDVCNFKSLQEAFDACRKLLPHECFHYFLQPDAIEFADEYDEEMAHFYTEGLVEKEARLFSKRHKDMVAFENANYGFNISFVNMIQNSLGAASYQDIFGEKDYLKKLPEYKDMYEDILKNKQHLLDSIPDMIKDLPIDLQERLSNRIKTMILQNGNADLVLKKLNALKQLQADDIGKKSHIDDEQEL